VTTVAGVAASVTTVAGISSNVTSVAGNATNINTVAGSIANVNNVGGSIASVNTVAGELGAGQDVTVVAANLSGTNTVGTVSNSIANVNAVGTNISAINAVNGNATNINTVAGQISPTNRIQAVAGVSADITTVAGIAANVTTVASISGNVSTVASNNANVATVGVSIGSVNTVSGSIASVNTNATNIANINQNAANITAIQNASANATAAATSATAASGSATAAANSAAAASAVVLGNEPVRPSVRPSLLLDFANTRQLDPRITFTRASTATFYDGRTVAKAEENLLLRSQEFDTASWFKARATVTANSTAAPDGTTTADTLTQTSGQTNGGALTQSGLSAVNGLSYTLSVFAKPDGKNFISVGEDLGTGSIRRTYFDVSTGAVGTTAAGHTASIAASSNGFYRCVITFSANASRSGIAYIFMADADNNTTVVDSGGVFIWGAQIEQRSSVTAYTATTTAPITNYIPALQTAAAGVARFEHNPVTGESLGLEIEEQRTNLVTRSEEFDNAAWTKTNITVSANVAIAPDGTLTADKVIATTSSMFHEIWNTFTSVLSTVYTGSYFVKAGEHRFVQLLGPGSVFAEFANFDLLTGTRTAGTAGFGSIQPVGNGWHRISISASALSASATARWSLALVANGTVVRAAPFTGDGYSGIYVWGAQLEAGAFATSYIPTVASQVTRSADAASMTGTNFSSWYRADEGTIYSECSFTATNQVAYSINGGSTANRMFAWANTTVANNFRVITNDSTQVDLNSTASINTFNKQAAAYATNNFASVVNGGTVGTDTAGLVPVVNRLQIGIENSGSSLNGTIKKIAYFPRRVTNAELQGMTTV
jgi:hypothetical protein